MGGYVLTVTWRFPSSSWPAVIFHHLIDKKTVEDCMPSEDNVPVSCDGCLVMVVPPRLIDGETAKQRDRQTIEWVNGRPSANGRNLFTSRASALSWSSRNFFLNGWRKKMNDRSP